MHLNTYLDVNEFNNMAMGEKFNTSCIVLASSIGHINRRGRDRVVSEQMVAALEMFVLKLTFIGRIYEFHRNC